MLSPVLEFSAVSKAYGGLRPLRIHRLVVDAGTIIGLAGFDQTTAEVFVNLATGATLPEEGIVRVLGRPTAEITASDDWLATVDRFGIVSERVVLLEQFTPLQNIAMSFTLDVEPLSADVRQRAEALALEAGLDGGAAERPIADGGALLRRRVRLARALAHTPAVLLVEHPAAGLDAHEAGALARILAGAAAARTLAVVVLSAQAEAALPFVPTVLTLNGGTGELTDAPTGLLGKLKRAVTGRA